MRIELFYLLLGIAFLFAVYRLWTRQAPESWLPDELKDAKLTGVEALLELNGDYGLRGRVDRLYTLADGRLVPVERKNRTNGRVYGTDKLQLSLYAYILEVQGNPVAPFGYVVFPGSKPPQRVELLNRSAVEEKLERLGRVRAGEVLPLRATGPKCRGCSHMERCA